MVLLVLVYWLLKINPHNYFISDSFYGLYFSWEKINNIRVLTYKTYKSMQCCNRFLRRCGSGTLVIYPLERNPSNIYCTTTVFTIVMCVMRVCIFHGSSYNSYILCCFDRWRLSNASVSGSSFLRVHACTQPTTYMFSILWAVGWDDQLWFEKSWCLCRTHYYRIIYIFLSDDVKYWSHWRDAHII